MMGWFLIFSVSFQDLYKYTTEIRKKKKVFDNDTVVEEADTVVGFGHGKLIIFMLNSTTTGGGSMLYMSTCYLTGENSES